MLALVPAAVAADRGLQRTPTGSGNAAFAPLYAQSHALLVGSSRYRDWPTLPTIPSELDDVAAALGERGFEVERITDPDTEALRGGIRRFVEDHGYEPDNRLLIYFSGHGHSIGDKGFLLPVDAPLPDDSSFRRHALPMTQVLAWARDMEARHALFVFDSCFSGTVFKSRDLPGSAERYLRAATAQPVRQFLTAGDADQTVPSKSTFTPAFVDAIRGAGDLNEDGYVTGSELGVHLSQLVPRFVDQTPQYGKIREYALSRGDFVFSLGGEGVNDTDDGADVPDGLETMLWRSAERDDGITAYRSYLDRFPDGVFAAIARHRLAALLDTGIHAARVRLDRATEEAADLVARADDLASAGREADAPILRLKTEIPRLETRLAAVRAEDEDGSEGTAAVAAGDLQRQTRRYIAALATKVQRNWRRPSGTAGAACTVQVDQSIGGDVLRVHVESCDEPDAELRTRLETSVERAVYASSPLPLPESMELYDRRVRMRFVSPR